MKDRDRLRTARILSAIAGLGGVALGVGMLVAASAILPRFTEQDLQASRQRLEQFKAESGPIPRPQAIAIGEGAIRLEKANIAFDASVRELFGVQAELIILVGALSCVSWWFIRPGSAT